MKVLSNSVLPNDKLYYAHFFLLNASLEKNRHRIAVQTKKLICCCNLQARMFSSESTKTFINN